MVWSTRAQRQARGSSPITQPPNPVLVQKSDPTTSSVVRFRSPIPSARSDLLGLVARRQAALWKDWRPWLALIAIVVPLATVLSIGSKMAADRMLEFLVEEMGFRIFAIEANWTEALRVNDYILRGEGDPAKALAGMYFGIWNTKEMLALIEWMRAYNLDPTHKEKLQFLGFDMQFSHVALQRVLEYLQAVDPEYEAAIREPLQPLLRRPLAPTYTNLPVARRETIAQRTTEVVDRFDDRRAAYVETSSVESWSVARRNAVIVGQAADMYRTESPSVQSRDLFMAENVVSILEEQPNKKAVLWAHNGHVGKQEYGPIKTMGMHLDERFGSDMVVFGFAFHRGAFRAIEPGKGVRVFNAPAAFVGGLDETLSTIGSPLLVADLRPAEGAVRNWLDAKQRTWSIGAVFSEELSAHYQPLIAPRKAFDVLMFVENTTASQPVTAE